MKIEGCYSFEGTIKLLIIFGMRCVLDPLNGLCMFVAIFGTAEKYGRHLTLAQSNVCTKMIYHKY
jgi:hypothetical protein